jgi:ABC-2 type transport system ATP-binding protein
MLEAIGLTKTYNRIPAVSGVSFTIRPGEVLGYLGPNGSGKSTTVKMLTGLIEPSAGRVLYGGCGIREDINSFKSVLGYVPEEAHLYPYLTGREYLQLAGRLRLMDEKELNAKIDALLDLLSLFEHRFSPIASYSKGMKQKVLLAAALIHNPKVLILDEPLSGLDVTSALIFKNLLQSLASAGKIVLYSSHVLEVVEKVCNCVMILRKGVAVAHDSVQNLRTLLESPSLEDVFSQLAVQQDTVKAAEEIAAVMRG